MSATGFPFVHVGDVSVFTGVKGCGQREMGL